MRNLRKIVKFLLPAYILIVTMLYFFQEKLIFLPSTLPQDYQYSFSQPFEEIFLTSEDGAILNAVHFKGQSPKGVLLYFHGNAGNLSRWGEIVSFFTQMDYDVIVMDYRTYGKSTGKLSEQALFDDAQLFYNYALEQYPEDIISLYGRSLGTGIATKIASGNNPGQLILETPYYSLMHVAKERFPLLPVKWLLKYKMNSFEYIKKVDCPIVVFHGTDDSVVPYESGKRLFDAIPNSNKTMFTIEGGEHNNLIEFPTYIKGITTVLDDGQSNKSEDR